MNADDRSRGPEAHDPDPGSPEFQTVLKVSADLDRGEFSMLKFNMRRAALAVSFTLTALTSPAYAVSFNTINLVSDDQSAHPAQITDAGLINAWGVSSAAPLGGPFWVSSNGAGTSTLYSVDPVTQVTHKVPLTVNIPGVGTPSNPTGQVFNDGFGSGAFGGDLFLFVNEDGTISGWQQADGTNAHVVGLPSALYKGAAFGTIGNDSYLYGANFRAGTVDALRGKVSSPSLSGNFLDPTLPSHYAPFNVQNLNGTLYVAYAEQDLASPDEVAGAGLGLVDAFDLQGNFLHRVATGGALNAPWGLAIAPSSFGVMAGTLLVGNFGDGHINAFDATTSAFLGQILGADGNPLAIDGLWAITPGNGGQSGGSSNLLYFTAGPDGESHGLFGVLAPVPLPPSVLLLGSSVLLMMTRRRARRHG